MDLRPKIGISINYMHLGDYMQYHIRDTYLDALFKNGALPILIPSIEDKQVLMQYLDMVSFIIIIGGLDYPPFLYKEKHDLPAKSSCIRHVYPAFDSYSVRFIRFHTTCFSGKYMMLRELSVLIST
jgi:gamma-glutamyl-gamma-aminobutyrate hydrolase PuuD